jgi:hypothetical protein
VKGRVEIIVWDEVRYLKYEKSGHAKADNGNQVIEALHPRRLSLVTDNRGDFLLESKYRL